MRKLEFDKISTYGLLRNTNNGEYYFISGFQLIKIMLSCKNIKTKIITEKEFHNLKRPQKYFMDNSKFLIFAVIGTLAFIKLSEYINILYFSNFERGIKFPIIYITSLIILLIISKIKKIKYKNNTEKIIYLEPIITDINSTKKRLRILLGMYVFLNVLAIMAIFNIFTNMDNDFMVLIGCLLPVYIMNLSIQDANLSFKKVD